VPTANLYWWLQSLVADHADFGFEQPPETFPKQECVDAGRPYGNWLRLPGRHHTRQHISRVLDGEFWLEGNAAIDAILAIEGDDPALMPFVEPPKIYAGSHGRDGHLAEYSTIPRDPSDNTVIDRAIAFMASQPPAIGGVGLRGHNVAMKAIGAVHRGFSLTRDETFQAIQDWNRRCVPPWSDDELWHKIDDAQKYPGDRGFLLDDDLGIVFFDDSVQDEPVRQHGSRPLNDYRDDMRRKREEAVATPGVYLDHSPTGSGKSHADLEPAAAAGSSLTILPTHANCQEHKTTMNDNGIPASAYPALTGETCKNLDAANKAITSGLSASSAVCPKCPARPGCQYHEAMGEADAARHAIATHQRAATGGFDGLAKGHAFVSIHENAAGLLRPTVEFSTGLEKLIAVVENAYQESMHWMKDDGAAFFWNMGTVARVLLDRLASAVVTESLQPMLPAPISKPRNVDVNLYRSMLSLDVWPNADTVCVVRAATAGELGEIVVRVDHVLAPGRAETIRRAVIAVWDTRLPNNATVLFADATQTVGELERLTGRPVTDITPDGHPEVLHPPLQITKDVKKSSTPAAAEKVLRSVIATYPEAQQIGVICHVCHQAMAERVERVVKADHFHGSESRGSNSWKGECDLLIVLGTPRVPPRAIKQYLIRTGRITSASITEKAARWRKVTWDAKTLSGESRTVKTVAYENPDWNYAHRALVHAELHQCIGRGRAVCQDGIDVVVVSNEPLGLPVIDNDPSPTKKSHVEIVNTLKKLSEQNPTGESDASYRNKTLKNILVGKGSVSSKKIAKVLGTSERYVRNVLNELESTKAVMRHGKRGGWSLPTPLGGLTT